AGGVPGDGGGGRASSARRECCRAHRHDPDAVHNRPGPNGRSVTRPSFEPSSEPSLEAVLAEAAPALLGYFVRRVDIAEDAADLVNETMIAAWKASARAPADAQAARMWLFGVARNILLHH